MNYENLIISGPKKGTGKVAETLFLHETFQKFVICVVFQVYKKSCIHKSDSLRIFLTALYSNKKKRGVHYTA